MAIRVENLTKTYGNQHAVDDVSFEIQSGQVVGFLGPNGAGKTTTMKILTCFIPQTSGSAFVCGEDVAKNPLAVKRKIGYLPETNPLYTHMYVREYLNFVAGMYGIKGQPAEERVNEMITITGLTPEQHKKIGQLSKGYRQRVGIAQAMLHDPEVLILDEPTSGLDPNQLVEIRDLIVRLGEKKTVMLSSHIMQEIEAVCDRVIIIKDGKIVADDKTSALQQSQDDVIVISVEIGKSVDENTWKQMDANGLLTVKPVDETKWVFTASKDIRKTIIAFATENDLDLLEIKREEKTLEEVFKELTKKQ